MSLLQSNHHSSSYSLVLHANLVILVLVYTKCAVKDTWLILSLETKEKKKQLLYETSTFTFLK